MGKFFPVFRVEMAVYLKAIHSYAVTYELLDNLKPLHISKLYSILDKYF